MKIEYKTFKIPKRSGGTRDIEQPIGEGMDYLKERLKEFEKDKELKPSYFAHAFMPGRNIVTCARQHFGKKFIARIDIKNFFGSISFEKFKREVFTDYLFWNDKIVNVVDPEKKKEFELIRVKQFDKLRPCFRFRLGGSSYLPQGSPTSPFLSNTFMRNFDWCMAWFCYKNGVIYNRYADDIFLSSDVNDNKFKSCIHCVVNSLKPLKLDENKKKRRIMKQGQRMNVVGIVLNEKFQIPKRTRKVIRAMLHNSNKDKTELTKEQKGLINFKNMVEVYESKVENNLEVCKNLQIIRAI